MLRLNLLCVPNLPVICRTRFNTRLPKSSQIVVDTSTLYRYERTGEGALLAIDNVTIEQGAASASSATADPTGNWVVSLVVLSLSLGRVATLEPPAWSYPILREETVRNAWHLVRAEYIWSTWISCKP